MADVSAWQDRLYQFALCLTRDTELSRRIVTESLDAAILRPPAHADAERKVVLQFQQVRKAALKAVKPREEVLRSTKVDLPADAASTVSTAAPEAVRAAVFELPEPGRTALALLLLDAMEADAAGKLLHLSESQFSEMVHAARIRLHQRLSAPAEVGA